MLTNSINQGQRSTSGGSNNLLSRKQPVPQVKQINIPKLDFRRLGQNMSAMQSKDNTGESNPSAPSF